MKNLNLTGGGLQLTNSRLQKLQIKLQLMTYNWETTNLDLYCQYEVTFVRLQAWVQTIQLSTRAVNYNKDRNAENSNPLRLK
jgi:hypothetical protein